MDRDDKIANIGAFLDIAVRALDAADALCDAEFCETEKDHDLALDITLAMTNVQDLQMWFKDRIEVI